MENVRKISKRYYVRQIVSCWLVWWMAFGLPLRVAMADPNPDMYDLPGGVGGPGTLPIDSIGINDPVVVGNTMGITQIDGEAIVNWHTFDIGSDATVAFDQASTTMAVLNRVHNGDVSGIMGALTANGRVFVINPAGIIFGSDASVNVAQLVASSLGITDGDFLDGLPYTFTGGATAGDIINNGTTTIDAEQIALIGQQVINRGSLVADDYVIMAAGKTVVLQADPGVSNVAVVVTMPEQTPGAYTYKVDQGGAEGTGDGTIDADHVILAAGDIWSTAIAGVETLRAEAKGNAVFKGDIHAEAGPGSDAIADVTIITGGDFTVEGYTITAEADALGVPDTDAIATVSITADGDVKVNADGPLTSALIEAKAENGEKNEAKVNIESTNGDVLVESEGMYEWAVIKAEAEDGIDNIADITIAAAGDVKVTNQGGFAFIFPDLDWALIEAKAHEGTTNTATVDIDAGDEVQVVSNEFSLGAIIRAEAWNEIELDPDIPAPVADEVVVVDLDTIEGLVNTATVDITASMVEIRGEKAGKAAVEAIARNDIEVDIENDDGEVAVNLAVADLQNTAAVTITANNKETAEYDDGEVQVTAKSKGDAGIKADAYNEIEIKHHKKSENPATMNLTLDGLVNNADVVINADDDVEVTSEDRGSDAGIEAKAWNELEIDEGYKAGDTTVNLTAHDLRNDADVAITTALDSVLVSGLNSGEAGIRAAVWNKLEIDESRNGGETTLNLTVDGLVQNDADVVINAAVDVEVIAQCEGDCSKAEIIALANNWLDEVDLLAVEETGLVQNNAGVDITAGEDVRVIAIDCGDATIAAVAENEDLDLTADGLVENNADVVINAGYDVLVQAVGGKRSRRSGFTPSQASIEAVAKHANGQDAENDADVTIGATNVEVAAESGGDAGIGATAQHIDGEDSENNADVTITTSGDVKVKASGVGSGPPSEATIEAIAMWGTNNNNAGVTITAGGNVEVAGGVDDRRGIAGIVAAAEWATNNTADVTINATNVKVIAGNAREGYKGTAEIKAGARYAENQNDADVTINADGDVLVHARTSEETAQIRADAEWATNNTANILINAGGDVEVKAGDAFYEHQGRAEIVAAAQYGTTNTADVTINADGDVKVIDLYGGETAKIKAVAKYAAETKYSEKNDADITINAGGNVEVKAGDALYEHQGKAEIVAEAMYGTTNTADVTINAGGDVKVIDLYGGNTATIKARAEASNNATALVDIEAGNVYVSGDNAGIRTEAKVWNDQEGVAPGDATATTKIDVGSGNVTLYDDVEADAYVWNYYGDFDGAAGDATATVDIDAGNVTVGDRGDIKAKADMTNDDWGDGGTFSGDAKAEVDITITGSLLVDTRGEIDADSDIDNGPDSLYSGDAIAVIDIVAAGDVTVEEGDEEHHGIVADADIDNYDDNATNTFTGNADADVYITALGVVTVDGLVKARADIDNEDKGEADTYSGSAYANVTIDNAVDGKGLGVTVGPEGEIKASADIYITDNYRQSPPSDSDDDTYSGDAKAGVDIETCSDVIVDGVIRSEADITEWEDNNRENDEYSNDTEADVIVKAYGDVIVNSEHDELLNNHVGSNGRILAEASDGEENSAAITVLAVGDVIVNDGSERGNESDSLGSPEEIRAAAHGDAGSNNNAFVGIATREGDAGNVEVRGQIGAYTWIEEVPKSSNTSNVEIYADQDLIVYGGYAEILVTENPGVLTLDAEEGGQITADADNGTINTANVDIYAGRDVIVHGAELEFIEPTLNHAEAQGNGGFYDGGQILALTWGNEVPEKNGGDPDENTSSVGIYAQRDVTINGATIIGEPPEGDPDSVIDGQVLAGAHGYQSINDADVVICAQDDVTIDGEVIAEAGTTPDPLNEHYADIVIAAGNADGLDNDGFPGGGIAGTGKIYAEADEVANISEASVTFFVTALGNLVFDGYAKAWDKEEIYKDPSVVVGPVDCPECDFDAWDWIDWTWCEDCEEAPGLAAAPIVLLEIPRILGCPLEMAAAALELGITPETIQVAIADALALNPTMQPCQACATLLDAAAILRDVDGSRMAAMNAVFNELAPSDAPFTPEMGASIVTAFAGAAEGSQYASVAEYVDAFVQYVAVVDVDLGSPVDDSLAFVMDKYGTGITGSDNTNLAAFVAARLESGATFGD